MSPEDQRRAATLRERIQNTKRGSLPGPSARADFYRLIAAHLPSDLAELAQDFCQLTCDEASGLIAPAGLNFPDRWFLAAEAEARARIASDMRRYDGFALSENRTAQIAGVARYTVNNWRQKPEFLEAVELLVTRCKQAA